MELYDKTQSVLTIHYIVCNEFVRFGPMQSNRNVTHITACEKKFIVHPFDLSPPSIYRHKLRWINNDAISNFDCRTVGIPWRRVSTKPFLYPTEDINVSLSTPLDL